jgi:hypothetical protein
MARPLSFIGAADTNPETMPYWDGCAAGKLLVRRCLSCGKAHHYPRGLCPFCFSGRLEWIEASGRGTIYAFSVMQRAEVAYAIAYVTLAEGPTMMTNIVDCDFDSVRIGMEVTLRFVPGEGGPPLPVFAPA